MRRDIKELKANIKRAKDGNKPRPEFNVSATSSELNRIIYDKFLNDLMGETHSEWLALKMKLSLR